MERIEPVEPEIHIKGWGCEYWLENRPEYCGKMLHFEPGKRCSIHYHDLKLETFFLMDGSATLHYGLDARELVEEEMQPFKSYLIKRHMLHQIIAGPGGCSILEISTQHFEDDSYRVVKGD